MRCVFTLNRQVIDSNRRLMNKTTQELMVSLNVLTNFMDNASSMMKKFSESKEDIELLKSFVEYEIKKTIKDIIHLERL